MQKPHITEFIYKIAPEKSWWCYWAAIASVLVILYYSDMWVKFLAFLVFIVNLTAFVYSYPKDENEN